VKLFGVIISLLPGIGEILHQLETIIFYSI